MSVIVGREALVDAFKELVSVVDTLINTGADLNTVQSAPVFSYILSPRQMSDLLKICNANGWPVPARRGMEISVFQIAHILKSRISSDNVSASFVGEILAAAYSDFGDIEINKTHGKQAIILNGIKKLLLNGQRFHAMAIISVNEANVPPTKNYQGNVPSENYLAPVTAYHATEAKIRGIRKKN